MGKNVAENFNSQNQANNRQINLPSTENTNLPIIELFADQSDNFIPSFPLEFSPQSQAVFEAGLQLWKYYHEQTNCNVNAAFYGIKEHFQGRNEIGRMNNKSQNPEYVRLISNLRQKMEILESKIQPKVYEFGFLR